ncbi:hypothetical protein [Microbacterium resistens]
MVTQRRIAAAFISILLILALGGCSFSPSARERAEKSAASAINSLAVNLKDKVPAERIGFPLTRDDFVDVRISFFEERSWPPADDRVLRGGTPTVYQSTGSGTRSEITFGLYQGASVTSVFTTSANIYGCAELSLTIDRRVQLRNVICPDWIAGLLAQSSPQLVDLEEVLTARKGTTTW